LLGAVVHHHGGCIQHISEGKVQHEVMLKAGENAPMILLGGEKVLLAADAKGRQIVFMLKFIKHVIWHVRCFFGGRDFRGIIF
jgi:hypothetical protein